MTEGGDKCISEQGGLMFPGTASTHQGKAVTSRKPVTPLSRGNPLVTTPVCHRPGPVLTGNPDVGLLTFGGSRGAPRHALAPVLLQPKHFLYLLPRDIDPDLHGWQSCWVQGLH